MSKKEHKEKYLHPDIYLISLKSVSSISGSSLRGPISDAIIKLNEQGFIQNLKKKWWENERGGGTCMVTILFRKSLGIYLSASFLIDRRRIRIGSVSAKPDKCWWDFPRSFDWTDPGRHDGWP